MRSCCSVRHSRLQLMTWAMHVMCTGQEAFTSARQCDSRSRVSHTGHGRCTSALASKLNCILASCWRGNLFQNAVLIRGRVHRHVAVHSGLAV